MLLDTDGVQLKLSPEQALSIAKEAISSKYWKEYEIVEIKLFYTPFWIFNFDAPGTSGRVALNAQTGELNEYVIDVLNRPFKKSRQTTTDYEFELDPPAITLDEVKKISALKIASAQGSKPEQVVTSGFYKLYIPFWRVWVNVKKKTYKLDIDAIEGEPAGFENVPYREKGWSEVAGETIDKMKTPEGLIDVSSKAVKEISGVAKGKQSQGFFGWLFNTNLGREVLLLVIVLIGVYFLFFKKG